MDADLKQRYIEQNKIALIEQIEAEEANQPAPEPTDPEDFSSGDSGSESETNPGGEEPINPDADGDDPEGESDALEDRTKTQLKAMLDAAEVEYKAGASKPELIALVENLSSE